MKNKKQALDALAADCGTVVYYLNKEGDTCALGCLGRLAGVSDEDLRELGATAILSPQAVALRTRILEHFGLTNGEQRKIQAVNDWESHNREARVAAVLSIVEAIPEEPAP